MRLLRTDILHQYEIKHPILVLAIHKRYHAVSSIRRGLRTKRETLWHGEVREKAVGYIQIERATSRIKWSIFRQDGNQDTF